MHCCKHSGYCIVVAGVAFDDFVDFVYAADAKEEVPYQTGQSLSLGRLLCCSDDAVVDIDDLNVALVCIAEYLNTKALRKETEYFVGCSSILH